MSLAVVLYQAFQGTFFYFAQFQFPLAAHELNNVSEGVGYRAGEVERDLPAFAVFEDVVVEKVVEAIFYYVLHHVVAAVLSQQLYE